MSVKRAALVNLLCFSLGQLSAFVLLNTWLLFSRDVSPGLPVLQSRERPTTKEVVPRQFDDQQYHKDDDAEAKRLERNVRVLCWIMTGPQNLDTKAVHVKNTWGRRCTKLLFMSSVKNDTFPTVGLNVSEGRQHLTAKTMLAFKYIYDHHLDDADWFIKADDDTYVILENLRHFLSDKNTTEAVFYGHHFHPSFLKNKNGYFAGGAGYVLSKAALVTFSTFGTNSSLCRQDGGMEDIEMGICMENLNVTRGRTTDSAGRRRFHPFTPHTFLHGKFNEQYPDYDKESGTLKGIAGMSDLAISFHYIPPPMMYDLEYFVYHLRPYGITSHPQDINVPI